MPYDMSRIRAITERICGPLIAPTYPRGLHTKKLFRVSLDGDFLCDVAAADEIQAIAWAINSNLDRLGPAPDTSDYEAEEKTDIGDAGIEILRMATDEHLVGRIIRSLLRFATFDTDGQLIDTYGYVWATRHGTLCNVVIDDIAARFTGQTLAVHHFTSDASQYVTAYLTGDSISASEINGVLPIELLRGVLRPIDNQHWLDENVKLARVYRGVPRSGTSIVLCDGMAYWRVRQRDKVVKGMLTRLLLPIAPYDVDYTGYLFAPGCRRFERDWYSTTVCGLLDSMPDDRSTAPVLADAAEEAGCTNETLLCALRGDDGPRLVWALDVIRSNRLVFNDKTRMLHVIGRSR